MKVNDKELADLNFRDVIVEGRLHHKKINCNFSQGGFKERWFKLRANILFYFNLSENGRICEKKPAGAMVLENSIIEQETISEAPFSFSITFRDDTDRKHLFSCRSEDDVNRWVLLLRQASYEFWRTRLILLQKKLSSLTGKDPLLMYPRNVGSEARSRDETNPVINKKEKNVSTRSFRSYLSELDRTDPSDRSFPETNLWPLPPPPPVKPARSKPNKVDTVNLIDL